MTESEIDYIFGLTRIYTCDRCGGDTDNQICICDECLWKEEPCQS
jgi:hypothetical protein